MADTASAVFRLAFIKAYGNFELTRNKAQKAQASKFLSSFFSYKNLQQVRFRRCSSPSREAR